MHVEKLEWLAKNPRHAERFALHVGALCRGMDNKAVAQIERLQESEVKDLSKLYMTDISSLLPPLSGNAEMEPLSPSSPLSPRDKVKKKNSGFCI